MDWDATEIPDLTGQVTIIWEQQPLRGGYANVYKGQWEGKAVAIKTLVAHNSISLKSMLRKIKREGCIWASLDHPNILPLYGSMKGHPHLGPFDAFISPWCLGGDSSTYLQQNGNTLSLDERLRLFLGVTDAVAYLHGFNPPLVHGDIKPANVLIDESGNPRLCDFGLARIFLQEGSSGLSTTTAHTGTERYLAPELLTDKDALPSIETDIYALGCVGLKFIFLQEPYAHHANNLHGDIFIDIRSGKPPATILSELGTPESKPWEVIVSCWKIRPIERPSASELGFMLGSSESPYSLQPRQQGPSESDISANQEQTTYDVSVGSSLSPLTAEALAVFDSNWKKEDVDPSVLADAGSEEDLDVPVISSDIFVSPSQSVWGNVSPAYSPNTPERVIAPQILHNSGDSQFNLPHQPGIVDPFFVAQLRPFQQAHSFPLGSEYNQQHGNVFTSEAYPNMGHQVHQANPLPYPKLLAQAVPQLSPSGPSNYQQYTSAPNIIQKQHGQRYEMDIKLLDGALKPGSYHPDPPLRILLELIRQQPFYMNETFEPSLETVEAERLLAVVRQVAPHDPRFAPWITGIDSADAPSTSANELPKNSIYMLFTENNTCLLCGKQTDRSGRVLGHVRSDLEHRPYQCDCPKCMSSLNPRKFFSDNLLDDHKRGQIVKQKCPFCLSSIRRGGMQRHMQSVHGAIFPDGV
ncbi:kinase-like protein [Serendipita vermifera]|nr:kinase-like protein [Serendipita vermifera]